ncbi:hypothetical protein MPLB_600009 [Mesorhizobium sp. ORS 3324]|nr:hypothetical protein MPLB_600009 [Mesorhizobium sp. ORS 3324]
MEFHRQTERFSLVEDARDLIRRKGYALAKAVDGVGKLFGGNRRQDRAGDEIDESVLVAFGFGRQRVRGETGGADRHLPLAVKPAGGTQRLLLIVGIETVAGLDLDDGDAFGQERIKARQRLSDELVLARGAQRFHGRDDASPCPRHLFIGGAGQPHLEFVGAVAGIDKMRVAVDQARRDPAAVAVDGLGALRKSSWHIGFHTGIDNEPVARGYRAFFDEAEASRIPGHGRQARIAPETKAALPILSTHHLFHLKG